MDTVKLTLTPEEVRTIDIRGVELVKTPNGCELRSETPYLVSFVLDELEEEFGSEIYDLEL